MKIPIPEPKSTEAVITTNSISEQRGSTYKTYDPYTPVGINNKGPSAGTITTSDGDRQRSGTQTRESEPNWADVGTQPGGYLRQAPTGNEPTEEEKAMAAAFFGKTGESAADRAAQNSGATEILKEDVPGANAIFIGEDGKGSGKFGGISGGGGEGEDRPKVIDTTELDFGDIFKNRVDWSKIVSNMGKAINGFLEDNRYKPNQPKVITKVNITDILTRMSQFLVQDIQPINKKKSKARGFNDYELNLYSDAMYFPLESLFKVYLVNDLNEKFMMMVYVKDDKGNWFLLEDGTKEIKEYDLYVTSFKVNKYKNIKESRIDIYTKKGYLARRFVTDLEFKVDDTPYYLEKINADNINKSINIKINFGDENNSITNIQDVFKDKGIEVMKKKIEDLMIKTQDYPELMFQDTLLKNFPETLKTNTANLSNNIINFISTQKDVTDILGETTFDEKYKKSQLIDIAKRSVGEFLAENKIFVVRVRLQKENQFHNGDYLFVNQKDINISNLMYGDYIVELYYLRNTKLKLVDISVVRIAEDVKNEGFFNSINVVKLSDHDKKNMITYWETSKNLDYYTVEYYDKDEILLSKEKINKTFFEFDGRVTKRVIINAWKDGGLYGSYNFNT